MDRLLFAQDHGAVARLLSNNVPTAESRLWCVLSGECCFDGTRLQFDGTAAEYRELRERARSAAELGDTFVIWTPRQKRQRGRIPKALRCGYTMFMDGEHLVVFQSVAFVPRPGTFDLIASTPAGQFLAVPNYYVAAWDGSPVEEPAVTVLS